MSVTLPPCLVTKTVQLAPRCVGNYSAKLLPTNCSRLAHSNFLGAQYLADGEVQGFADSPLVCPANDREWLEPKIYL
jgi:hypothetical protein